MTTVFVVYHSKTYDSLMMMVLLSDEKEERPGALQLLAYPHKNRSQVMDLPGEAMRIEAFGHHKQYLVTVLLSDEKEERPGTLQLLAYLHENRSQVMDLPGEAMRIEAFGHHKQYLVMVLLSPVR